jgi:hypothetical protein
VTVAVFLFPAHIAGRASYGPRAAMRRSAPVIGGTLPATPAPLVPRTDFSDDAAWDAICTATPAFRTRKRLQPGLTAPNVRFPLMGKSG